MRLVILITLGTIVSQAAPPVKAGGTAAKVIHNAQTSLSEMNQDKVDQWTQIWRRRLSLEDWEVTTLIVHQSELKPDTLGNLHWNSASKTAIIRVLNPADYDLPASEIPDDIEYTIVHELVHLQLAALPRDANGKNTEEKVVNGIAEALIALERGPSYKPRTQVAHLTAKDHSPSEASRSKKP
jgi:hypothetical protein